MLASTFVFQIKIQIFQIFDALQKKKYFEYLVGFVECRINPLIHSTCFQVYYSVVSLNASPVLFSLFFVFFCFLFFGLNHISSEMHKVFHHHVASIYLQKPNHLHGPSCCLLQNNEPLNPGFHGYPPHSQVRDQCSLANLCNKRLKNDV